VRNRPPRNMSLLVALAVITAPTLQRKYGVSRGFGLKVIESYTKTAFPKNMEKRRPKRSGRYADAGVIRGNTQLVRRAYRQVSSH
jgi:hypothetical protein